MFATIRPTLLALCLVAQTCAGAAVASAQAAPPSARTKASKPPKHTSKSMAPTSPAANLNAPSTDFSQVEPDTGDAPGARQRGPNIRPSLDSSGRPVMGLGF